MQQDEGQAFGMTAQFQTESFNGLLLNYHLHLESCCNFDLVRTFSLNEVFRGVLSMNMLATCSK